MRWINEEELCKWIITDGCEEGHGYIDEDDINGMNWVEDDTEKTGHWIPVSDELPEKAVLCCDRYGEMLVAYPFKDEECNTGYAASMDDYCMIDCVAWMPLPKPYEPQERSE